MRDSFVLYLNLNGYSRGVILFRFRLPGFSIRHNAIAELVCTVLDEPKVVPVISQDEGCTLVAKIQNEVLEREEVIFNRSLEAGTPAERAALCFLKIIAFTHRSRLTDDHLKACSRLAVPSLTPSLHALLDNMQSHPSHWMKICCR